MKSTLHHSNTAKDGASATRIAQTVDIATTEHRDGSFSYSFTLAGEEYSDHDFRSRDAALEEARSVARCAFYEPTEPGRVSDEENAYPIRQFSKGGLIK